MEYMQYFTTIVTAGIVLLVKRRIKPNLRRLSNPDDFIANFFVDIFLALTILSSFNPAWKNSWMICSILLFIYIPAGKIRHCFFFFTTRIVFGKFFGRRGVYPGPVKEAK